MRWVNTAVQPPPLGIDLCIRVEYPDDFWWRGARTFEHNDSFIRPNVWWLDETDDET